MCTRTLWNTSGLGVFVSRTMDWPTTTEPKLVVFPRGRDRDGGIVGAQRVIDEGDALRWTSTYGSLVTTVYGLGAADGVNERGLGAHMLFFGSCDFGARRAGKPGVQAGLWVQLLLDQAADVGEAVALLDGVDLVMVEAMGYRSTIHVAVEDAAGDSAIIEYVDGNEQVYHGREYTVMTNDPPYDQQLAFLAEHDFSEATRETPIPGNVNPRDRFVRAAYYCQALPEPGNDREAVAGVMAIARNVSVPFGAPYKTVGTVYNTEYRTVCDLSNLRYFFELTMSPSVLWADLDRFNLSAGAPAMVLGPDDIDLAGDVSDTFAVLDPALH
jgi:choloylglycine hydrolase